MIAAVLSWLIGSKAGRYAAVTVLAVLSAWAAYQSIKKSGAEAEKAKQAKASLDALRNRISTDDEIAKMPRDTRRAELARWVRGDD